MGRRGGFQGGKRERRVERGRGERKLNCGVIER